MDKLLLLLTIINIMITNGNKLNPSSTQQITDKNKPNVRLSELLRQLKDKYNGDSQLKQLYHSGLKYVDTNKNRPPTNVKSYNSKPMKYENFDMKLNDTKNISIQLFQPVHHFYYYPKGLNSFTSETPKPEVTSPTDGMPREGRDGYDSFPSLSNSKLRNYGKINYGISNDINNYKRPLEPAKSYFPQSIQADKPIEPDPPKTDDIIGDEPIKNVYDTEKQNYNKPGYLELLDSPTTNPKILDILDNQVYKDINEKANQMFNESSTVSMFNYGRRANLSKSPSLTIPQEESYDCFQCSNCPRVDLYTQTCKTTRGCAKMVIETFDSFFIDFYCMEEKIKDGIDYNCYKKVNSVTTISCLFCYYDKCNGNKFLSPFEKTNLATIYRSSSVPHEIHILLYLIILINLID